MTLLLGLDIGTTAIKALLYDVDRRRIAGLGQSATVIAYPSGGRSEFPPEQLWDGAVAAIRLALATADAAEIAGVGVATMGEVGVPLDEGMQPCYPAITWFDRRADPFLPWWERHIGLERTYRLTGQLLHSMYGALKLQWLRANEPDIWARVRHWLSIEDFIIYRLCGAVATDPSMASRTLLFDQAGGDWSPELLAALDLPRGLLPPILPSGASVGGLTADAAGATGLRAGTPVALGGHDHLVGALAVGAAAKSRVLDSAGTAESVMLTRDRFDPSDALRVAGFTTYRHVTPGRYVVVAGQHGAGGLINWVIDRLYDGSDGPRPYEQAFADAAASPVGAGGIFCLPHLRGSRVPERDLRSRAAFVGLTDGHGRGHLLRAAIESLGYWLTESLDVLANATGEAPNRLAVIGGATRSSFWLQTKADCTGLPLEVPEVEESVALGAALLAGVGAGVFADPDAAAAAPALVRRRLEPAAEAVRQYARAQQVYRRLYPALRDINYAIADLADGPDALTVV